MRVAIFLAPRQAAQVKAALESLDEICIADSWETLETLIRVEPLSVVVLNPAADGTMDVTRACRLIQRYSSIPFVAYVPLDAPYVRGIAHMSNDGLQDLVLVSSNDSPTRFRETLARVSSVQELSALVEKLQPLFRTLPGTLAQVLVDTLRRPHAYASAEDIAAASGMTVSGLYRSFRGARMSSPKSYVVGARAFRGYLYLRDAGFSVRDIAAKLGYTHPRIFAHQIECVLGERPSKIRRSLEIEECVQKLVTWFSAREGMGHELCFPTHLMDDAVLTTTSATEIGQLPSPRNTPITRVSTRSPTSTSFRKPPSLPQSPTMSGSETDSTLSDWMIQIT